MKPRRLLLSLVLGLLTVAALLLRAAEPPRYDEDNTGQAPPGSTAVEIGSVANEVGASVGLPNSDVSASSNKQSLLVATNPTGSSTGVTEDPAANKWAWAADSHWNSLPRLPDVRYAVVPLAALGIHGYHADGWAEALDNRGGLLYTFTRQLSPEEYGYNYLGEPWLQRIRAYWRHGASSVAEYDAYYLNDDDEFDGDIPPYGWALGDYNNHPWGWLSWTIPQPQGVLRQLSSSGIYASTWQGRGILANYPSVWATVGARFTPGPLPFLSPWIPSLAVPNTFGWVPAGFSLQGYAPGGEAVGVNRFGHLIVRQNFYMTTNQWPSSWGHSYAGLLYDASGNAQPLLGTDTLYLGYSHAVQTSNGQMLDPWFINDRDQVAGFRVTPPEGAGVNQYNLVSEPGIAEAGQFRALNLPPGGKIMFNGLTSGWPLPTGETGQDIPLVPPLAYGWSERQVTEEVNGQPVTRTIKEFWRARREPGTSAGWKTSLLTVFDPATANTTTGTPLPPEQFVNTGWLLMNDRLEIILGDHRIVRNQRLHDLNALVGGQGLWSVGWTQDLNNSGVVLTSAEANMDYWGDPIPPESRIWEQVLLVPVTMEWRQRDDGGEVSDNKTPVDTVLYDKELKKGGWMPGDGQRIFPDKLWPNGIERNTVVLRVTVGPALFGQRVYVKAFDVDDPVTPTFDYKGALDRNDWAWNGPTERVYYPDDTWADWPSAGDYDAPVGNDNREDPLDTPQAGRFVAGGGINVYGENDEMASGVVNALGFVEFVFQTGMQPGNNYRVAMTLDPNEAEFAFLQVESSADTYGYIGSNSAQQTTSGFGGVLSPLLTVWRRLYVEADTMDKWTGAKPSPDRLGIAGGTATLSPVVVLDPTSQQNVNVPNINLTTDFYGAGHIYQDGRKYNVNKNGTHSITTVPIAGYPLDVTQNFELLDDDESGLSQALLPHYNAINDGVKSKYIPAYISVVEISHSLNIRRTIPFSLNIDSIATYGFFDLAHNQDLAGCDSHEFWYALLVMAYQYTTSVDRDPNTEPALAGATPEFPTNLIVPPLSSVYTEAIRDEAGASEYNKTLDNVIAHELGHQPGGQMAGPDHNEGGVMSTRADEFEFTATSLARFRRVSKWSD